MHKKIILLFLIAFTAKYAQTDSTSALVSEVYVIDSYISPDSPAKLIISFATSDSCKSKIIINGKYSFQVSSSFKEEHRFEMEMSKIEIDSAIIRYKIVVNNKDGLESTSDEYEVTLPKELVVHPESNVGFYQMCLGGIIYSIPSISFIRMQGESYWGIQKEVPLFSFYNGGYNYPSSYFSIEYAHILKAEKKNFLRFGYKMIFQMEEIKFISAGVTGFTDFLGYNGLSTEATVGLFQIKNVFTFYTRYRYNFQLIKGGTNFSELSIGLYANIFSLNF